MIEPHAAMAVDLQQSLRESEWSEARCAPGNLVGQVFRSVQFSAVSQSSPTLCDLMDSTTPGLPIHHQLLELLKLMSIESVMPANHLILCSPLLLLPSIFPSIRAFSRVQTYEF